MDDLVIVAGGDLELDAVVVARRHREVEVDLRPGARGPDVLGLCRRAAEDLALLEVGHRSRVVAGGEGVRGLGRRDAAVGGQVVVDHADRAVAVEHGDQVKEAPRLAVDPVARGPGARRPADRVVGVGGAQVVGRRDGRRRRALSGRGGRGHDVGVVAQEARPGRGRHDCQACGRGDAGAGGGVGQGPARSAGAAQLLRDVVGVDQRQHIRRLHELDVEQVGLCVAVGDLVGAARREDRAALAVEAEVARPELDHHRVGDAEGEGQEAGFLGAVLDLAHELEACAVLRWPVGQGDEVPAQGEARLVADVVDPAVHLGRDLAPGHRAEVGARGGTHQRAPTQGATWASRTRLARRCLASMTWAWFR